MRILSVLALLGLGIQAQTPASFAALDTFVESERVRVGAPGLAVVIVEGDKVVHARGYGVANVETAAPITPDTLFQIGSVTKTFTAAAILADFVEGGVSLDSPVSTFVSGLRPCIGKATVGQLLAHTGGLIDEPDEFGPHGEEGLAAYPRTWTDEYCLLPPGRAYSYSNSGYALAGLALQERSKKPFAEVMRARVLDPLGMRRTTFRPTEAMTWPLAVGHRRKNDAVEVVRPLANDARLWPAGTLYSTPNEMARFLVALVNEGRVAGKQALPAAAVRAMIESRSQRTALGDEYGYGLELDRFAGHRRIGHGGTMTGYITLVKALPERKIAVAVFANGDGAQVGAIVDHALNAALGNPPATSSSDSKPAAAQFTMAASQLDAYVGSYTNPRRFTVEVVRNGDALVLRRFGRDFAMQPLAADRFQVPLPRGGWETIAFGRDAAGRAEYLQMYVWALARRAPGEKQQ